MKVIVLSSGSKGNTTYIETENTKLLIDMGNTCKYVKERLEDIGVTLSDLDGILITHLHVDHIKGLKVFCKKYECKIYLTEIMKGYLDYINNYQIIDDKFDINDVHVESIKTSHDTPDSRGYILTNNNKSIVYITDTGYINQKYFDILRNRDLYIMESNHDVEMLTNGKYPYQLRQRILSDKGHLSNYDSSRYLSDFVGDKTKYVLLAHLSKDNNTEKLAYETLVNRLSADNKHVDHIIIAKEEVETDMVLL